MNMYNMNMKKPVIKAPVMPPQYGKPMNTPYGNLVKKSGCGCGKKKIK